MFQICQIMNQKTAIKSITIFQTGISNG
jgi:hypothetical protein